MSVDDCPRRGKLFGGCKFEGRYDVIPPQSLATGSAYGDIGYVRSLTKRIYVGDVCVRCGKTVPRSELET